MERYEVDVSAIPLGAFVLVAAQIDKFAYRPNDEIDGRPLRRPATERDMVEMNRRGLAQREDRRALNLAATTDPLTVPELSVALSVPLVSLILRG